MYASSAKFSSAERIHWWVWSDVGPMRYSVRVGSLSPTKDSWGTNEVMSSPLFKHWLPTQQVHSSTLLTVFELNGLKETDSHKPSFRKTNMQAPMAVYSQEVIHLSSNRKPMCCPDPVKLLFYSDTISMHIVFISWKKQSPISHQDDSPSIVPPTLFCLQAK